MRRQREQSSGRQRPTSQQASQPRPGRRNDDRAPLPTALPPDQAPTARFTAPAAWPATDADISDALPPLDRVDRDEPLLPPTQTTRQTARTLVGATTAGRAPRADTDAAQPPQQTQALATLKTDAERERAVASINTTSGSSTTLIPGARRYRPPTVSVVPRRSGPRSAVTQFAVSMIVTALLISGLTLSTPLGQAAALDVNGPLHAYSGAAPWLPTPTPTPKPKPATSSRPPAGANPGQQAVINEIVAVFGSYSQGALAVSKCESGYDSNAWNSYPILNSHASGVFQILYPSTWNTTSYAGDSPFDANANIHAAYQIFQRDGYSWREWQCQP
ncbi:MAG TPA: hypothetical protein VIC27_03670 [Ktedonobacterales bacterium]